MVWFSCRPCRMRALFGSLRRHGRCLVRSPPANLRAGCGRTGPQIELWCWMLSLDGLPAESLFRPRPRNSIITLSGPSGVSIRSQRSAEPRRLKLTPGNMSIMYQLIRWHVRERDNDPRVTRNLRTCRTAHRTLPTVTWPLSKPVFLRAKVGIVKAGDTVMVVPGSRDRTRS